MHKIYAIFEVLHLEMRESFQDLPMVSCVENKHFFLFSTLSFCFCWQSFLKILYDVSEIHFFLRCKFVHLLVSGL